MTRTGPADVVMSARDLTAYGRPLIGRLRFRGPGSGRAGSGESVFARGACPASACCKPAHYRLAGRSGRLRPVCPLSRPQRVQLARSPHPTCPRSPAFVHSLYLYLLRWHTAPLYGWSFDPGRDFLCIFISPPRWLQLP
jgi:hypothetical protein